nr:MAG TPA: hypothetical protein [Caudoviricetes sp.]
MNCLNTFCAACFMKLFKPFVFETFNHTYIINCKLTVVNS